MQNALFQPARGGDGQGLFFKAEGAHLLLEAVEPKFVSFVWADDGDGKFLGKRADGADVVDVGVGEPELFELHAEFCRFGFNACGFAAGVDGGGFFGVAAPEDGAVLFKGGDRDGVVAEHGVGEGLLLTRIVSVGAGWSM